MNESAVVLLSGGIDSATLLAHAEREYKLYALSIDYGQRNLIELESAKQLADKARVRDHLVLELDATPFRKSALTNPGVHLPRRHIETKRQEDLPATYVPGRNAVFLSLASAWAETVGAGHVFIGLCAGDQRHSPDGSPEFVAAYSRVTALCHDTNGTGIAVEAPLIHLTKPEIIEHGLELGVDFGLTHTCYDPDGRRACGTCDACLARRHGFAKLGIPDPVRVPDIP